MNEKKIKKAYTEVNQIMDAMDKEFRQARRVPIWRKVAAFVGWKKPQAKWLAWGELRHNKCMRSARKHVARSMMGSDAKMLKEAADE